MKTLFDSDRMSFERSIDLTAASLTEYGRRYRHWAVAFSGGKDSSCAVTLVAHLLEAGRVPPPESITCLYADTRMELPPLQTAALSVLGSLKGRGWKTAVVLPKLDDRFFVYMLGRGIPPPKNRFRWCTAQIKIEPMLAALKQLRDAAGEKLLMLTGVRLGESAVRDQRIAVSCSRDGAECGQGWFQEATPEAIADTLAPILHWRVCLLMDWLNLLGPEIAPAVRDVARFYSGDQVENSELEVAMRTGCVGCNLASKDVALDRALSMPEWAYLAPLKRLRPLYQELKEFKNRLQKNGERKKDGTLSANPMRKGPLTMAARRRALNDVLQVQLEVNAAALAKGRPQISLINDEELARIEELIAANTWPDGWTGEEPEGDVLLPQVMTDGSVQQILFPDAPKERA